MSAVELLASVAPDLEWVLTTGSTLEPRFEEAALRRDTVWVTMRDGVHLATELLLPPTLPAPAVVMRTPYGRALPKTFKALTALALQGYIVVSQDCRGTGDSEPDNWDYYVFEREDSFDLVSWITQQAWFNGFIGGCGSSYLAQTQWCMALNPHMSAIVPEVGGLGLAYNTARLYMFLNVFSRAVGKGDDKSTLGLDVLERQMLAETLQGGYFNEPLYPAFARALVNRFPKLPELSAQEGRQWLWGQYCNSDPYERVAIIKDALGVAEVTITALESLPAVFGQRVAHDAHMFPSWPQSDICQSLYAPALMITGWYDWGLPDVLATWQLLANSAPERIRGRTRLIITPSAHNVPGYHEGAAMSPELNRTYRTADIVDLIIRWYATVKSGDYDSWPPIIYYLLGANEWCTASVWPPLESKEIAWYLGEGGTLSIHCQTRSSEPDTYLYQPHDPTPTVGGSILSLVYPAGSVDVQQVQARADVLTYTTEPLDRDLDIVGPVKLVLYASSTAVDTDFTARLTDVFPDGRAIQLQSGLLRARHRGTEPEVLEPGRVYRLEIDMWATANRFKRGHRIRIDIASADFPRFDRNSNRGGAAGEPIGARQHIYRDKQHPSRLILSIVGEA